MEMPKNVNMMKAVLVSTTLIVIVPGGTRFLLRKQPL